MNLPAGLYGIADAAYGDPVQQGIALATAGCPTVQLRAKGWSISQVRAAANTLAPRLREHGTCFIINDHPEVAAECGAHGLHLGQSDGDIRAARSLVGPQVLIGRSTHNLQQIQEADGADYIGFGPIFPTSSKADCEQIRGIERLHKAVDVSPVPVIAIGGISLEQLPGIVSSGAHGWAVIRALAESEDLRADVRKLHLEP